MGIATYDFVADAVKRSYEITKYIICRFKRKFSMKNLCMNVYKSAESSKLDQIY